MLGQNIPEAYRIYPMEKAPIEAVDNIQSYQKTLLLNVVIAVISFLVFLMTNMFMFVGITIIGIICGMKFVPQIKKEKQKVTDIAQSFAAIENYEFVCLQAAENNTYEECNLNYLDIENVLPQENNRGFYIWIKENAENSFIKVDGCIVNRNIFFVDGLMYDSEKFIFLFEKLLYRVGNKEIHINEMIYKKWRQKSREQIIKDNMILWIFGILVVVLQIIYSNLF